VDPVGSADTPSTVGPDCPAVRYQVRRPRKTCRLNAVIAETIEEGSGTLPDGGLRVMVQVPGRPVTPLSLQGRTHDGSPKDPWGRAGWPSRMLWARSHLIRIHGVLAPNAKLRSRVVPQGPPAQAPVAAEAAAVVEGEVEPVQARGQRIGWARQLERFFDIDLQHCPRCGAGELKIIAAILERAAIEKILTHLGLDPQPPPRGRAREAGQARSCLSRAGRRSHSRHGISAAAPPPTTTMRWAPGRGLPG
jgi:hypothetical protein